MLVVIFATLCFAVQSLFWRGVAGSVRLYPPSSTSLYAFFGNVIYSFEGVTAVIPLTSSMTHPSEARRTVAAALVAVASLQLTIMTLCYLAFTNIDSASIVAALSHDKTQMVDGSTLFAAKVFVTLAVVFRSVRPLERSTCYLLSICVPQTPLRRSRPA